MKISRKLIGPVYHLLDSVKNIKCEIRTAYNITKNKKVLFSEIEAIQEASKPTGIIAEYERERLDLCRKYCEKDSNNRPVVNNNSFVFSDENRVHLDEDMKPILEKFPNIQESLFAHDEMVQTFMNDEVELDLILFKLDSLPNDSFTVEQIELLSNAGLIEE